MTQLHQCEACDRLHREFLRRFGPEPEPQERVAPKPKTNTRTVLHKPKQRGPRK